MASVHEIGVGVDTRPFEDGIKRGLIRPTEDAEDAFKELERSVSDAGSDGARDLDKLEEKLKDVQRESERVEKATEKIGDGGKRGFGQASEATSEFKNEATQNFSEIASSFDGSMESIGELAQGTLGGLASSGLPGIGVAAGIAALGIGGITSRITELQERAKETTEGIVADFIEMGTALDSEAVRGRVSDILNSDVARKEAQLLANLLEIDLGRAALALAGDFDAAGVSAEDAWDAIAAAPGDVNYDTWVGLKSQLKATEEGMMGGALAADAMAGAMDRKARADLQAAVATGKVTEEVDELGNRLFTLPDGKQIMIDAETEQATTDVDNFKGDVDGVPEEVSTRVRFTVDSSEYDRFMRTKLGGAVTQAVNLVARFQGGAWD